MHTIMLYSMYIRETNGTIRKVCIIVLICVVVQFFLKKNLKRILDYIPIYTRIGLCMAVVF